MSSASVTDAGTSDSPDYPGFSRARSSVGPDYLGFASDLVVGSHWELFSRLAVAGVWRVDLAALQLLRQVDLVGDAALVVVRVAVVAAVAHRPHQSGDRVAQVQRHRLVAGLLDELARGAVRSEGGVRLRRERKVERGLGQRQHRL